MSNQVQLGAFSISLAVKDLAASKAFYELLGFQPFAGSIEHNYLIMKNEAHLIGLFQGMFDNNILTFNPGWDQNARALDDFQDVRELKQLCVENNISIMHETNTEQDSGPASFAILDPDGNAILIDQHV